MTACLQNSEAKPQVAQPRNSKGRSWRSTPVAGPTGNGSKGADTIPSPKCLAAPAICAYRPLARPTSKARSGSIWSTRQTVQE